MQLLFSALEAPYETFPKDNLALRVDAFNSLSS